MQTGFVVTSFLAILLILMLKEEVEDEVVVVVTANEVNEFNDQKK